MSEPLDPKPQHLVDPENPLRVRSQERDDPTLLAGKLNQDMPGPATMDASAKQSFLWSVHGYLAEYARFADTKAAFAGTLAGAILGGLYGAKLFDPINRTAPCTWPLASCLAVVAGIFLVATMFFAIRTVYPRLRPVPGQGYIFWGNILRFDNAEELLRSFHSETSADLINHLLRQNFTVSKYVCTPKYRNVSFALISLSAGAVLGAAAFLLKTSPP